jgi:predicted dehydrogenase
MTLRIGILGAARVATYAMIGAATDVEGVIVAGVAARDSARAHDYAQTHGIPTVFPDYASLIAAPGIDAVYNALPPSLHAAWSIAALEAGKPVLCEKPFALTVRDAEAMLAAEAGTGQLLMEAQHTWYHPINIRARQAVAEGAIGTVRHAMACFNADIARTPDEIRWNGAVGGGALWDLGCYPAWWMRGVLGNADVVAASHVLAESGADIATRATLRFAGGAEGVLITDMVGPRTAWMRLEGDKGVMLVDNPLSATLPQSLRIVRDGAIAEETFTRRTSFAFQLEAFRDAVCNGATVATRGENSLAVIRLLAAIRDMAGKEH